MDRMIADGLPFFIAWGERTGADVADPPDCVRATSIEEVALGGYADAIASWLGEEVPGLRLVGGAPGVREVVLGTPTGRVVLR